MTGKGAAIEVGAWLGDLGVGEHEAIYCENAINEGPGT
jgi:hypothetical protein